MANAERDAAQAKADLAELKRSLPVSPDLKAAAMAADVIKPQRKSAKQFLARADVTLEKLQSIDASLLTPTDQERPSIAWSGREGGDGSHALGASVATQSWIFERRCHSDPTPPGRKA